MWQFTGSTRPNNAIPPKAGQESVWDYPRPPICTPDKRKVIVQSPIGIVIAKTNAAICVLETASPPTFYIPAIDVDPSYLAVGSDSSFCEWKGAAKYWDLSCPSGTIRHVGWMYDNPSKRFQDIAGYFSFYPSKLDCFVDGEHVRPQPGGFYGGWVTDEILGPYKGEPGTGGW